VEGQSNVRQPQAGIGDYFGVSLAPTLTVRPLDRDDLLIVLLDRQVRSDLTVRVEIPPHDAYFVLLYLQDVVHRDLVSDGSRSPIQKYQRGSICLVDLQCGAAIELHSSLHAIAFLVPRDLMTRVNSTSSAIGVGGLRTKRGEPDPVLSSLGAALIPFFNDAKGTSSATLRPMATALCLHLIDHYAVSVLRRDDPPTSLSIWKEKAVKEYIVSNLSADLTVSDIAAVAELSVGHFSREFKKATGLSPHQWLTRARIDCAKDLLMRETMSLKSIAKKCGFVDPSHFSRTFRLATGCTPAAWRKFPDH
jgi:AraC-like DNA-binding protein